MIDKYIFEKVEIETGDITRGTSTYTRTCALVPFSFCNVLVIKIGLASYLRCEHGHFALRLTQKQLEIFERCDKESNKKSKQEQSKKIIKHKEIKEDNQSEKIIKHKEIKEDNQSEKTTTRKENREITKNSSEKTNQSSLKVFGINLKLFLLILAICFALLLYIQDKINRIE